MDKITIPLWKNKGKNSGRDFLVGKIQLLGLSVMVFKNNRKEKPNQPDYNLVISRDTYNKSNQMEFTDTVEDEIPF